MGGGLPSLNISTSKTNMRCVSKKKPLVLLEPMWCFGTHVYVCNDPVGHDSKRPNYIHACTSIRSLNTWWVRRLKSLTRPSPIQREGSSLMVQKLLEYRKHLIYTTSLLVRVRGGLHVPREDQASTDAHLWGGKAFVKVSAGRSLASA